MTKYVLGSDDQELARLDGQAAAIDAPTRLLMRAAGIGPGMRVLDLGTGIGHVARAAAELVGETGQVVGLDNSPRLLEVATSRSQGIPNLRFVEGDVRTWRDEAPFDAIVGRLILFHLPDAIDVVRHQIAGLRPGGLFLAMDFDVGSARSEPPVPLMDELRRLLEAAFRSAGADPVIGPRLGGILGQAGLGAVQTFGIQAYMGPEDPRGFGALAGAVRSMSRQMFAAGLTTPEKLDVDTLPQRLAAAVQATGSAILPPALAGAWGRRT